MELRGKKKNVHVWLVFGYNEVCFHVINTPLASYIPDAKEKNLPNDLCTQNSDYTYESENSESSRIIFFLFLSVVFNKVCIDLGIPDAESIQIFSTATFHTNNLWKNQVFIVIGCLGPPQTKFIIFLIEISESGRHL